MGQWGDSEIESTTNISYFRGSWHKNGFYSPNKLDRFAVLVSLITPPQVVRFFPFKFIKC